MMFMQRHRFSHAAAAQDADHLSGHHVESDILQHLALAECLGYVVEFYVRSNAIRRPRLRHAHGQQHGTRGGSGSRPDGFW